MLAKAVVMDDTQHFNIPAEDVPFIKQVLCVYVYDPEEATHCCELTPSRWLETCYTTVVTSEDCPEDVRERLWEDYSTVYSDSCYMHCSDADRLESTEPREFDSLEDAREYFCGNCPF